MGDQRQNANEVTRAVENLAGAVRAGENPDCLFQAWSAEFQHDVYRQYWTTLRTNSQDSDPTNDLPKLTLYNGSHLLVSGDTRPIEEKVCAAEDVVQIEDTAPKTQNKDAWTRFLERYPEERERLRRGDSTSDEQVDGALSKEEIERLNESYRLPEDPNKAAALIASLAEKVTNPGEGTDVELAKYELRVALSEVMNSRNSAQILRSLNESGARIETDQSGGPVSITFDGGLLGVTETIPLNIPLEEQARQARESWIATNEKVAHRPGLGEATAVAVENLGTNRDPDRWFSIYEGNPHGRKRSDLHIQTP